MNKERPVVESVGRALEQEQMLQWHPAFYADIQIELTEGASNLRFENEHQLSTKPMEIDRLVSVILEN